MHGVYTYDEAKLLSANEIGDSAYYMKILQVLGVSIPKWFVLAPEACRNRTSSLVVKEINRLLEAEFASVAYFVVRFSALNEIDKKDNLSVDSSSHKICSRQSLLTTIDEVLRVGKKIDLNNYSDVDEPVREIDGAILVSEYIETEVSGLAYGINPQTGNPKEIVIHASFGIFTKEESPDSFDEFILHDKRIKTIVRSKPFAFINGENGIQTISIDSQLQLVPALSNEEVEGIGKILTRIKNHFKKPQNIEFGILQDQLYVFHASAIETKPLSNRFLWSNEFISESYKNISLPLTYSFFRIVQSKAYIALLRDFGLKTMELKALIAQSSISGHILGRIFVNITSLMYLFRQLPGIQSRYVKVSTIDSTFLFAEDAESASKQTIISKWLFLIKVIVNGRSLNRRIEEFHRKYETFIYQAQKSPLQSIDNSELSKIYWKFKEELIPEFKLLIQAQFYVRYYLDRIYGLCSKLQKDGCSIIPGELYEPDSDFLLEPLAVIEEIVEMVNSNQSLKILFSGSEPTEIYNYLLKYPQSNISLRIFYYIHKYGDKVSGELKFETGTFRQDPVPFVQIIKELCKLKKLKIYNKTEQLTAKEILSKVRVNPIKAYRIKRAINKFNKYAHALDNMRPYQTKVQGYMRDLFLEIGRKFQEEGILCKKQEIFYLKENEITDYIQGSSSDFDLQKLVDARKTEYAQFGGIGNIPANFYTYGAANSYRIPTKNAGRHNNGTVEYGIGLSSGVLRKATVVFDSLVELERYHNKILVVKVLDAGILPILNIVAGIIAEEAEMLNEIAIICRKNKIPLVSGIKDAQKWLVNGPIVELNGATGAIVSVD